MLAEPTKMGYTFDGWYSDENLTEKVTEIKQGTTGDITLYAKWSPNQYTIKFNGNGAYSWMKDLIVAYDQEITLSRNTCRKSWSDFKGWNTKADGTGTSYEDEAVVTNLTAENGATVTLYAQWVAWVGKYTITYYLNGGEPNPDNPATYDEDWGTITLYNPTKEGYTFAGWYKDKKFKKKSNQIKYGSTGPKKFYAKWTPVKYTVKFSKNGGTGKMSAVKNKVYDKKFKLPANKFKRKGYKFVGWNTEWDGSGTDYRNKEKVKNLRSTKGTITLYAQWEKK